MSKAVLNKLQYDVQGYFRAYYHELRKQLAEHPEAELPRWFEGGRRIETRVCRDGIVIAHLPYDEDSTTFPGEEGSFAFYIVRDPPLLVKDMVARYTPPLTGGDTVTLLDYVPGEYFGVLRFDEPLRVSYLLVDEHRLTFRTRWTLLDVADTANFDAWHDRSEACRRAREVLRRYLR